MVSRETRHAVYIKLHHTIIDGASAMRLVTRMMSTDPGHRNASPIWAVGRLASTHTAVKGGSRRTLTGIAGLRRAGKELRSGEIDGLPLRAPYNAPASPLRAQLNGQRRLVTKQFELDPLKSMAKAAGCTLNDLVLFLSLDPPC